jgi:hypothetical protein
MSLAALLACAAPVCPAPIPAASGGAAPQEDSAALERALAKAQAGLEKTTRVLEDHSSFERAWVIPTRDYEVRTSLNWYIGKRLAEDLEAMLAFFRDFGRTNWRPQEPLSVHLYGSLAEYNSFGEQFGAHHSSILGSFWASDHPERPVALYMEANPKLLAMWATHSAFHQFAEQAFPSVPDVWVSEGLASYFSIFFWDAPWGAAEFRRAKSSDRYVPLRQLMREPLEAYAQDPDTRFVELGALFHYLLNHRPDTRIERNAEGVVLLAPAQDYLIDLLRGRDVSGHPLHELLHERIEELEADFKAFDFPP